MSLLEQALRKNFLPGSQPTLKSIVSEVVQPTVRPAQHESGKAHRPRFVLPVFQGQPPEISIRSMIDRYLFSLPACDPPEHHITVRLGGKRSQGVFHPSELCKEEKCPRAMAYELFSAPNGEAKTDPKLQRIFDMGHFVHARVEHYLEQAFLAAGGEAYRESGIPPNDLRIAGTPDFHGVLYTAKTGGKSPWPYTVEIKSMNKRQFGDLGAAPWPDHVRQLNIYMGLVGTRAGIVLVECKDNCEFREYFVRFDPKMWEKSRAEAEAVLLVAKQGKLPPQISQAEGCSKECKFYAICRGSKIWSPSGPLQPLPPRK